MESLPTEQNDIEKLNTEPATGPGVSAVPVETTGPASSPVVQNTPPPVPQTPQPQFDPPMATTPSNLPKKSHKKRNIIIAVVVLLLLAAGTIVAIMLFSAPKKDTAKKSTTDTTKPLDDAQGIVTKINTAITDTSKDTYQNPQVSFTSPTSAQPAISPSYQVKGTDYYVVTNQAYGLNIQKTVDTNSETGVDTVFTQGIMDQVTATLVGNKYSKTTELASGVEYQSDAVICTVSGTESIPMYVTCANKNAYAKVSGDVKPLVTAYRASHSDSSSEDIFSAPTIKSSSVDGYQTASVGVASRQGIGSAAALFYRKGTDEWKFFNFAQAELNCSDYNTADLKAAFADQPCISDSKTDTTVKDYAPGTKKTSGSTNSTSTNSTTKNDMTQNSGAASSSTNP
jgi:hypothetical protein